MRYASTISAITNSSSEIFVLDTADGAAVEDACRTLWDEFRNTNREAWYAAEDYGLGFVLNREWDDVGGVRTRQRDGKVVIEEGEPDRLFEWLGFSRVLRTHFGDAVLETYRN